MNFLLVQALQYRPRVLILDLGGGYRSLSRFLGGGYLELSPDDGRIGRFLPLAPVQPPSRGTHISIPDRMGPAIASARRYDNLRRRSH